MGLEERGPESATSFPGQQLVALQEPPAPAIEVGTGDGVTPPVVPSAPASPVGRARREVDDGRRGTGYLVGAFKPADGEALPASYAGRTTAHSVDVWAQVEAWMAPDVERM